MSVIGIDFGNESCYVAAAKAGGIETLANDYSLRATPSFVAFDGKKRIIGVAAKNQQVTNMKNTVSGFKCLLGRKFNDPHVQRELSSIPTKVDQRPDGSIGYKVNYLDQEQYFSPEQLTAMLFTKLKETSTTALQAQVNDCVITCPAYFSNSERKALLDAAQIAGLNVLRLMNETTATALSYGFYKQDLPDESKPRNVVFVDCGNSSLQVSVCAFTKGKLKMLASAWDQIGGRDFDSVLAEHFAKEFYDRYKLNAKTNPRAYLRLLTEIEKLKKQMSANSTKLPINIECFMDDVDVSSSMQRSQMEDLSAHLFKRVEMTFVKLLQDSKLSLDDIHSVEVVGGTTRIPAIKQLIEQVFGKPARTTLNQDESVSRGAALQCAIMSPAVRVREFGVTDIQNYAVKVSWDGEGSQAGGEIEVFPAFHSAPFSRLLTLNRKEPFSMTVQYAQAIPFPDPVIGKWFIKDVKPNERGEHQEVKVKVRINHHGLVLISSASLVDKKEEESSNAGVTAGEQNLAPSSDEKGNAGDQQQQTGNGGEPMDVQQEGSDKKKKSSKLIELPMEVKTHGFSSPDLQNLVQQEAKMIANDARETQRVDARNALEEYVYDMRNKLQGGPLERYVLEADREAICSQLNDLENWLYEEGEDCDRDTYVNKLKGLHTQTDPIKERANDYENAPVVFDELNHSIQIAHSAINEFKKGAPKYDHLTEAEFLNISEAADKAQKWLNSNMTKFTQTPRMYDSPVKVADIRHEVQTLNACVNSVINRPKPKPAAKPAPAKDANSAGADEQNGENAEKENDKAAHNPMDDATMDVE
ncbi:heat shock 70 kDa protein 4 isoform X2 [Bactrocera oleae]|uniref:heat shock 70 kDa protein 4 isoform X2 n=1 Tax=Bactrocera oleae TaxID=104688 RepID=UPI0006B7A4D0|nr:heat shock 70 kDa protein 4 isoform X2 [Bactrocera oleae]XP_014098114.1 heat shock 70 kDa protein 4 isoform X2 [Bactrocera oleae]XP_014098115.1 heat shock 70 kDa protein 4 isoform X2 [Bactrocera oleae]XP_014098116.1 heat shock 70 kDa protein 4 isoform X2 [Bactrocera oleae]XP_036229973.1 heat shock 70 kDa protein 4 isoform X2 [Bactrocera oleae]XP_036229974.1 heat shock 70 kDa protein 4 isoform X2 [Bactrocera oleae]XP_036229975.1 heat shock 70 kDa protein 4 isoform X2 [Bactrocera oleae]XP_0